MCLRFAISCPDHVLEKGKYLGLEYIITHNGMHTRCGYVRVEPGHPWHEVNHHRIKSVQVHGSLTFSEADVECEAEGADNAWWVGFDCGHALDLRDYSLPSDDPLATAIYEDLDIRIAHLNRSMGGKLWTLDMVRDECYKLAEQAVKAAQLAAA